MLWAVGLSGLLAAAPITVASPGFETVNVQEKVGGFALAHLSERLGALGIKVITPAEIQAVLGIDRQRQLLGCSDGASCSTELMDALGAEATMLGTLAKLGDTIELSIKVISSRTGARRAGFTERVRDESALFEVMDRAATSLAEQLNPPAPGSKRESGGLHLRKATLVPAIIGGVALAAAGVTYGLAVDAHFELTDRTRPAVVDGASRAATGQTLQTVAAVAGGVGVAAAAVAVWFYVTGDAPPVTASVGPVGGGAVVSFGGRFP
jgi:hypothetical protein